MLHVSVYVHTVHVVFPFEAHTRFDVTCNEVFLAGSGTGSITQLSQTAKVIL